MARIRWQPAFETGISEVDNQHRQFIRLVNSLEDLLGTGEDVDVDAVRSILEELVDYADYHFSYEQEFQEKMAFSDRAEHTARHDEFRRWLRSNLTNADLEDSRTILDLLNHLMDWFLTHVLVDDMKFGQAYARLHQVKHRSPAVV